MTLTVQNADTSSTVTVTSGDFLVVTEGTIVSPASDNAIKVSNGTSTTNVIIHGLVIADNFSSGFKTVSLPGLAT